MVFGEQTLDHFAAGSGANGIADTVVLGEGLDFVEAVLKIEILPAVFIADRDVELDVQAAQLKQGYLELRPEFVLGSDLV